MSARQRLFSNALHEVHRHTDTKNNLFEIILFENWSHLSLASGGGLAALDPGGAPREALGGPGRDSVLINSWGFVEIFLFLFQR